MKFSIKFRFLSLFICSIILNGIVPFSAQDTKQLIEDQNKRRYFIKASILQKLSIESQVVIHTLLEPDENIRWDAARILNLNWLNGKIEKKNI